MLEFPRRPLAVARQASGEADLLRSPFPSIPKQVFVTMPTGLEEAERQELRQSLASATGFEVRIYNDEDMENSVYTISQELEEVGVTGSYDAFHSLCAGAYKADLWRYMVLWSEGGIYIDEDVRLTSAPSWVDLQEDTFVLAADQFEGMYWNGIMASSPRHPVMQTVIRFAVNNVAHRSYGENDLDITGPRLLYRAVQADRSGEPVQVKLRLYQDEEQPKCGPFPLAPCDLTILTAENATVARVGHRTHKPHNPSHYSNLWKNFQVFCEGRLGDVHVSVSDGGLVGDAAVPVQGGLVGDAAFPGVQGVSDGDPEANAASGIF